jgi:hypothetical protein
LNKLPLIIQATAPKELGAGLLLRTEHPLIIGKIIQFASYPDMIQQLNSGKFIVYSTIPGYSIAIVYAGIMGRGYKISGEPEAAREIQTILDEFRNWYIENKIEAFHSQFKRYKLD